jgi:hypothetical protein
MEVYLIPKEQLSGLTMTLHPQLGNSHPKIILISQFLLRLKDALHQEA